MQNNIFYKIIKLFIHIIALIILFSPLGLYADIYLDKEGDESPSGKSFSKFWFREIGIYDIGQSTDDPTILNHEVITRFINKNRDIINWQIVKELKTGFYFLPRVSLNMHAAYLKYLYKEGIYFDDIASIFSKCISEHPIDFQMEGCVDFEPIDVLLKMGEKGQSLAKDIADNKYDYCIISGKLKEKDAIPGLIEILSDTSMMSSPKLKEMARKILSDYGNEAQSAIPELLKLLEAADVYTKFKIIDTILKISPGNPIALEVVKKLKEDPQFIKSEEFKVKVYSLLSSKSDIEDFKIVLNEYMSDDKKDIYKKPLKLMLDGIGPNAFEVLLKRIMDNPSKEFYRFLEEYEIKYYDQIVPFISENLKNNISWIACANLSLLKKLPPEKIKPLLPEMLPLLKSKDIDIRNGVLNVIGILGQEADATLPDMLALLKDVERMDNQFFKALKVPGDRNPEQVVDYMIKNKVINDNNKIYFIYYLEKCKIIPNDAIPFLINIFIGSDGFKSNRISERFDTNMKIYKLIENNPDFIKSFMPSFFEMSSENHGSDYAVLYIKNSPEPDTALNHILPKIKHIYEPGLVLLYEPGLVLLEFARITGDYQKAFTYAKDNWKPPLDINSKFNYLFLLVDKNNYSDEDRIYILTESSHIQRNLIIKIDSQNIPILIKLTQGNDKNLSFFAKQLLISQINMTDCPDDLFKKYLLTMSAYLKDPDHKLNIFQMLKKIYSLRMKKDFCELIFTNMVDDNGNIEKNSVTLLESLGSSILPELSEAATGDDPFISMEAISIISGLGARGRGAAVALEKVASSNPDWTLRVCAINALGEIGPSSNIATVLPLLKKALDDEKNEVAKSAAQALILLGGTNKGDPALEKICRSGLIPKDSPNYKIFEKRVMEGL